MGSGGGGGGGGGSRRHGDSTFKGHFLTAYSIA